MYLSSTSLRRSALLAAFGLVAASLVPNAAAQTCGDVNFDTDPNGHALHAGAIIDDEYAAFGITVTTDDPVNHPAMIFDTANPTGGDSDLATPGSGLGNDTALGKVLIVSEDGDTSDPDDDGAGGTLIFTFDSDTEVVSVGLLDIDLDETVTVTAFDEFGAEIASTTVDGVGNGGFQRAILGAEGVRRLEVDLSSSGALADLDINCDDKVCEDAEDLDFDTNAAGDALAAGTVIDDEYAAFGLIVTTNDPVNHPAMIFDTANPTGEDDDLATPGDGPGNDTALGNVLIISEDADSSDPDDNGNGGTLIFLFEQEVGVASVGILDIDTPEGAEVKAFDGDGNEITSVFAEALGNNSAQTVAVDAEGVRRLEVTFSSSGAVTGIDLECEETICEDFDVDLMPIGSTTVPAEGGFLTFKVTVVNNSDAFCSVEGWLNEERPDGVVISPARGPITLDLEPNEMFMRTFRFRVPSDAMAGEYFCVGAVGTFPDILADDGFFWTKLEGTGLRPSAGSGGEIEFLFADTGEPVGDDWRASAAHSEAAVSQPTSLTSYPNPFHAEATVEYTVSETGPVSLRVYDLTGRVVATLADGTQEAGTHRVSFDGRGLAAGTYLYRLQVGDETRTHRVVLTK